MQGKHWLIIVRATAVLWYISAALTLAAVLFPGGALSFFARGTTFGAGFLAGVQTLWIIAGAAFSALIGWLVWKMDLAYKQSLVILCVIILAFSVLSGSYVRGIIAAITLVFITRRQAERLFIPGGQRTFRRTGGRKTKRAGEKSWLEF